jgi:ABC-type phosphate transport system substrate-binding protein
MRAREAEDQRDVGHKPVADTEHGGPGAAALDVAVVVLVRLALALALALALISVRAAANVVAVVSSKSAIRTLTVTQVADIFLGRMSRFPDGTLAVPIDLSDGSAERDQFYLKVAGKTPAQVKAYWSKIIFTGRGQPPKAVRSALDMRKYIAANIAAIGYIDETLVDDSVRVLE